MLLLLLDNNEIKIFQLNSFKGALEYWGVKPVV